MNARFNNKRGYIEKLCIGESNIVLPWGIEFADSASFFSLDGSGWRTRETVIDQDVGVAFARVVLVVELLEGRLELSYETQIVGNKIIRKANLVALEDSLLMDFVVRYRFSENFFSRAVICGRTLSHRNTNLYYQYPVRHVELTGSLCKLHIATETVETAAGVFEPFMYVRDNNNEWIVHCRLLPRKFAREVVKLNASWYNRALPLSLGNLLLKLPGFKEKYWYRPERRKYSPLDIVSRFFRPAAYPIALLKKGKRVGISSYCEVIEN